MTKPKVGALLVKRTAAEMIQLLRERYPDNQYAFLPQVRDGAGFDAGRTIDAVVMSTWPSRGLELMGMEIKVDRGDWRRELAKPEKADGPFRYMDRWYIVAPAGIVWAGELPSTWGLIEAHGKALRQTTEAPKLTPLPIDRSFLASILRKTARSVDYSGWDDAIVAARNEGYEAGRVAERDTERHTREVAQGQAAIASIAQFKTVTGIDVGSAMRSPEWTGTEDIIPALKWVIDHGGWDGLTHRLSDVRRAGKALVALADSLKVAPIDDKRW